MPDLWDDEQLLALLKESLRAYRAVPPEFVAAGKNAYAWHNVDAELAQLTYDSTHDREPAGVRSEAASIRSLTFTSAHLTIELEVTEDALLGQAIPAQAGTVEVQTREGVLATIPVDKIGYFTVRPVPAGPFRLQYRAADGSAVLTGWVTL